MRKATITNNKGTKFEATVFSTREDAVAYATKNPVLARNKGGSFLRQAAQVHALKNGEFAVI